MARARPRAAGGARGRGGRAAAGPRTTPGRRTRPVDGADIVSGSGGRPRVWHTRRPGARTGARTGARRRTERRNLHRRDRAGECDAANNDALSTHRVVRALVFPDATTIFWQHARAAYFRTFEVDYHYPELLRTYFCDLTLSPRWRDDVPRGGRESRHRHASPQPQHAPRFPRRPPPLAPAEPTAAGATKATNTDSVLPRNANATSISGVDIATKNCAPIKPRVTATCVHRSTVSYADGTTPLYGTPTASPRVSERPAVSSPSSNRRSKSSSRSPSKESRGCSTAFLTVVSNERFCSCVSSPRAAEEFEEHFSHDAGRRVRERELRDV